MEWLDALRPHLLALPNLAKFAIIIAIIVGVPALARCLRIPELIALLVFGVLLGPHVLGVYGTNHPIVQFFADLGMLMLMFTAGLEIDINLFRRTQTRSITFGVITTMVPQVLSGVRLFDDSVHRYRLAARFAHPAQSANCHAPWRRRAGTDCRLDRCHSRIGHAIADHLRDLRFDLHDRLFAIRSCGADR